MGYIRGVVHGAIVGTTIGLCIAPQEGERTRQQLRGATATVRQGLDRAQETAQRLAPAAESAAQRVIEIVGQVRGRSRNGEPSQLELTPDRGTHSP